ncbi:MAG: hypothetical protein GY717_13485 [Rhodobacteraceae bacterium]|nr:hypothetical protein [Paracoccaceae bacterium]
MVGLLLANLIATASFAAATSPDGEYSVVAIRRASDVAAGPDDPSLAGAVIGSRVAFGAELLWLHGKTCTNWSVTESTDPVATVGDPIISDTQVTAARLNAALPDHRVNRHLRLVCGQETMGVLLQVDQRVLVVPSPSGASYLILERRVGRAAAMTIEEALTSAKLYDGPITGHMGPAARRGAALFAGRLGAEFDFLGAPITENMAEALGVHDLLPREPVAEDNGGHQLIKTIFNGPVAAHFLGDPDPLFAATYGVRALEFSFEGDPQRFPFRPRGTLYYSDWYFDALYSPGSDYVLLLQDRFGPYHLVRTGNLKPYLLGEAGADFIVGRPGSPDLPAAVHAEAHWLSPEAVQFTATCCGTTELHRHYLAIPAMTGSPQSAALAALRPGLPTGPDASPNPANDGWPATLRRLAKLNATARQMPGQWTEGNIALGADPQQYQPSEPELIAASYGDMLIAMLSGMDPAARADALRSTEHGGPLRYTRFDTREVKVMGSGLYHYASAPQFITVELGTGR